MLCVVTPATAVPSLISTYVRSQRSQFLYRACATRVATPAIAGRSGKDAGAEVPIGVGVIGTAAERRRVVCVPNMARTRSMKEAVDRLIEAREARNDSNGAMPLP